MHHAFTVILFSGYGNNVGNGNRGDGNHGNGVGNGNRGTNNRGSESTNNQGNGADWDADSFWDNLSSNNWWMPSGSEEASSTEGVSGTEGASGRGNTGESYRKGK